MALRYSHGVTHTVSGGEHNSNATSAMTDSGLDVSRQPAVVQLTSSGTDLDPHSSDLINGLKFLVQTLFYFNIVTSNELSSSIATTLWGSSIRIAAAVQ